MWTSDTLEVAELWFGFSKENDIRYQALIYSSVKKYLQARIIHIFSCKSWHLCSVSLVCMLSLEAGECRESLSLMQPRKSSGLLAATFGFSYTSLWHSVHLLQNQWGFLWPSWLPERPQVSNPNQRLSCRHHLTAHMWCLKPYQACSDYFSLTRAYAENAW